MRLPHLQVAQESFGTARVLAGLLKIHRQHAHGLLVDLWAWALDQGPADAPPTGLVASPRAARVIAAAVEWPGNPDELAQALEDAGALERLDVGFRVRGLARYAKAWEEAERGRQRKQAWRERREAARETPRNGDGTGTERGQDGPEHGQTQTQTQTHVKEASLAPARARDEAQDEPMAERERPPWSKFLAHLAETREQRNWLPDAPDSGKVRTFVDTTCATAVTRGLAPDMPAALALLCQAYTLYLARRTELDPARAPWRWFEKDVYDLLARAAEGRPAVDPRARDSPEKKPDPWAGRKVEIKF